MTSELAHQTKNAFEFMQKLHFEISYLIKEVEGLLQQEDEGFIIGKPSGYAVTSRTSSGLEPINVEMWIPKTFTVFFAPKSMTEHVQGQSVANITPDLKVLLLHIELAGKDLREPRVIYGCIRNISSKKEKITKFEHLMWEFSYCHKKIFSTIPNVTYEDAYCSFNGTFRQEKLFSINSSEEVVKKLIEPMLRLYREA